MPLDDRYGNPMTTTAPEARDRYIEGVDHILGASVGAADAFEAALQEDPGFALAHAGLARARMFAGDMAGAKDAITSAEGLTAAATPREAQHVKALSLLLSGQPAACADLVRRHVRDWPRDALVAQMCCNIFGLIGFSGRPGREAELFAYTEALLPHYGEDWWMLSMHALSLCEIGQVDASLEMMERALTLNPRNAHASHFKAHGQYEAGQTTEGLRFLKDWMQGYDPRGQLHGHLSWHAALWSLETGDIDGMWHAIDAHIAPGGALGLPINILTDTAALYHRADLAGHVVGADRWRALSDYAAQMFPNPGQSFADLHAALCHAMAGDGDRLAVLAEAQTGYAADLVRPMARAWGALARSDWQGALDDLTPVMSDHARLGGSRAQRDLLELTWVNILLKLGRTDEAKRSLATRRTVFAGGAPVAGLA